CNRPEPCAKLFVHVERMIAISSTHFARFGYRSETSMPDLPCFENLRGEPNSLPGLRIFSASSLVGMSWPLRLTSSGLGSNVSTWLTPPYMNRQMTALAFAAKCGFFGASGPGVTCGGAAARPSSASSADRARPAKPPPVCIRKSRRAESSPDMATASSGGGGRRREGPWLDCTGLPPDRKQLDETGTRHDDPQTE